MADATAQKGVNPSHRLRLVPHVMASFGAYFRLDEPLDKVAQDILAITDRMEGGLFRLGRWSEAYEIRIFRFTKAEVVLGKEHPSTLMGMSNLAIVLELIEGSKLSLIAIDVRTRASFRVSERSLSLI